MKQAVLLSLCVIGSSLSAAATKVAPSPSGDSLIKVVARRLLSGGQSATVATPPLPTRRAPRPPEAAAPCASAPLAAAGSGAVSAVPHPDARFLGQTLYELESVLMTPGHSTAMLRRIIVVKTEEERVRTACSFSYDHATCAEWKAAVKAWLESNLKAYGDRFGFKQAHRIGLIAELNKGVQLLLSAVGAATDEELGAKKDALSGLMVEIDREQREAAARS